MPPVGETPRTGRRSPPRLGSHELMRGSVRLRAISAAGHMAPEGQTMAKSQKKSNREVRKPKAEKVKTIAANASTKDKPVNMVTIKN
jgi:hypothetical protein